MAKHSTYASLGRHRGRLACALVCAGWLALGPSAHARTWSFENASTGLSPLTALGGSAVTLDGDFDFTFNAGAGAFEVSSLNLVLTNTTVGTFSNFTVANVTTTGQDRVFNFDGFSGFVQLTVSFTVTETGPDNSLDDSNPTGTVQVTDRPGGFIGGFSIPPHDVLVTMADFLGTTTYAAFDNVLLDDPNHVASNVPLPAGLPLMAAGLALAGALGSRRRRSD